MRYWEIIITDPKSGSVLKQWSSQNSAGGNDYSALEIEMDVMVYFGASGYGKSALTIRGVSLHDLSYANNYSNANIEVKGGFSKGLPLANPAQAGTLFKGQIFEVFGNWVGTAVDLSFTMVPSVYTGENKNLAIHFQWNKGQTLTDALAQCFRTYFPGYTVSMAISDKIVSIATHHGIYHSLDSLADAISQWTQVYFQSAGAPGYLYGGVQIGISGDGRIIVTDATQQNNAKSIAFTDLIGQPTWADRYTMQIVVAMRADIQIGSYIKLPKAIGGFAQKLLGSGASEVPGFTTTTAQAYPSQIKYISAFQGDFMVTEVRQVGNSRAPSGDAWVTVLTCIALAPGVAAQ